MSRIVVEKEYCRYRCTNGREFIFDKCDLPFFQNKICTVDERGYVTTNRKKNLVSHLLLSVGNDVPFLDIRVIGMVKKSMLPHIRVEVKSKGSGFELE